MTDADIYSSLTEILQDIFMRDDIVAAPSLTAQDVAGWDSFKQIEVVIASEERFGVKFSSKEIESLKSIGDLALLVGQKTT